MSASSASSATSVAASAATRLPADCMTLLVRLLDDMDDILAVTRVCSGWRHAMMAKNQPCAGVRLRMNLLRRQESSSVDCAPPQPTGLARHVGALWISGFTNSGVSPPAFQRMLDCAGACVRATKLTVTLTGYVPIAQMDFAPLAALTKLTYLELNLAHKHLSVTQWSALARLSNLKHIVSSQWSDAELARMAASSPTFQLEAFDGGSYFDEKHIIALQGFPSLTRLRPESFDENGVACLMFLPDLRDLTLSRLNQSFSLMRAPNSVPLPPLLHTLALIEFNIGEAIVATMLSRLPLLTTLSFTSMRFTALDCLLAAAEVRTLRLICCSLSYSLLSELGPLQSLRLLEVSRPHQSWKGAQRKRPAGLAANVTWKCE